MRHRARLVALTVFLMIAVVGLSVGQAASVVALAPDGPGGLPEAVNSPANVKIDPATKTVNVGDTFTVDVKVEDAQNLGGFDFSIDFNPAVVSVTGVEIGDFLSSTGRTVIPLGPTIEGGTATFGALSVGTADGPNGDGTLATVNLEAIAEGTSPLTLNDVTLYDAEGAAEMPTTESGEVVVQGVGPCVPVTLDALTSNSPVALGQAMTFEATVSGTGPFTYTWDFGGTGMATGEDTATPTFTYDAAGTYTVDLTVENACGTAQDSLQVEVTAEPAETTVRIEPATQTVEVGDAFTANVVVLGAENLGGFEFKLDFNPAVVKVNSVALGSFLGSTGRTPIPVGTSIADGTVTFAATSAGTADGPSGTGVLATLNLEALAVGTSPLTLHDVTLYDPQANPTTPALQSGQVVVEPEVCTPVSITGLTSDSPVMLGEAMHFTATVSGTPLFTYTWDFGGTGTGTGLDTATPSFTYAAAGLYTVDLTVENACGTDEESLQVEVTEEPVPCEPVEILSITPLPSAVAEAGEEVEFRANMDGDQPILYEWDFGDGSPVQRDFWLDTIRHTYSQTGTYTVSLNARNCQDEAEPAIDEETLAVTVIEPCDIEILSLTSDSPAGLGEPMHFTAEVSGTEPISYTWSFGGPGTATGEDTATPTFIYDFIGQYWVTLSVENYCGTDEGLLLVEVLDKLAIKVDPPTSTVDYGDVFTVDVVVEDVEDLGGYEFDLIFDPNVVHVQGVEDGGFLGSTGRTVLPFSPVIDNVMGQLSFGAGSLGDQDGPSGDGTLATITLEAVGLGTSQLDLRDAILLDTDADDLVPTTVGDGSVEVTGCEDVTIDDLASDSPVMVGETMHFTTTVSGTPPYTYTWDFDGAGTAMGEETAMPSFTYDAAGTYTVTLDVENPCSTAQETLEVEVEAEEVMFYLYLPIVVKN